MALAGGLQDPTYLAYLRAMGLEEDVARQNAARQTGQIQRQVQSVTPEIARLGLISRGRIGDSFEARGVYRSGQRKVRQAENAAGEGYRVGQLYGQATDRIGNVQGTLQQSIADLARQRADRSAAYGVGV